MLKGTYLPFLKAQKLHYTIYTSEVNVTLHIALKHLITIIMTGNQATWDLSIIDKTIL